MIKVRVWARERNSGVERETVYEFEADEWEAMSQQDRHAMEMEFVGYTVESGHEVLKGGAAHE